MKNKYRIKPLFPLASEYYTEFPYGFREITKNTRVEGGEVIKGNGYLLFIKDTLSMENKQKLIKSMQNTKRIKLYMKIEIFQYI